MDLREKLQRLLTDKGYSVTRQRLAVFEVLLRANTPLSTVRLADQLSEVDKASVYRTVELFEEIGIAQRVWTGFKSKVELSDAFSPHHHHFTCVNCGKVIGVVSDRFEAELKELENKHGFKLTRHSIELSGYCSDCK